jgi:hypothetical protein
MAKPLRCFRTTRVEEKRLTCACLCPALLQLVCCAMPAAATAATAPSANPGRGGPHSPRQAPHCLRRLHQRAPCNQHRQQERPRRCCPRGYRPRSSRCQCPVLVGAVAGRPDLLQLHARPPAQRGLSQRWPRCCEGRLPRRQDDRFAAWGGCEAVSWECLDGCGACDARPMEAGYPHTITHPTHAQGMAPKLCAAAR